MLVILLCTSQMDSVVNKFCLQKFWILAGYFIDIIMKSILSLFYCTFLIVLCKISTVLATDIHYTCHVRNIYADCFK